MNKDLKYLRDIAKSFDTDLSPLTNVVLDDPKFLVCPGSIDNKHHSEEGGLLRHTREVVELSFNVVNTLKSDVDEEELYFSALFHDIGKIHDYEKVDGVWVGTQHKRKIHHLSRSALIWNSSVERFPQFGNSTEGVLHAILSHHGQREWGSPVAPYTTVAWIVHLCDGLSARVNDCNKVDYLKVKDKN